MNLQQKKLHIFSVLVFLLLICCFYVLGGGTNLNEEETVVSVAKVRTVMTEIDGEMVEINEDDE